MRKRFYWAEESTHLMLSPDDEKQSFSPGHSRSPSGASLKQEQKRNNQMEIPKIPKEELLFVRSFKIYEAIKS
jgi:hypothetical protein